MLMLPHATEQQCCINLFGRAARDGKARLNEPEVDMAPTPLVAQRVARASQPPQLSPELEQFEWCR